MNDATVRARLRTTASSRTIPISRRSASCCSSSSATARRRRDLVTRPATVTDDDARHVPWAPEGFRCHDERRDRRSEREQVNAELKRRRVRARASRSRVRASRPRVRASRPRTRTSMTRARASACTEARAAPVLGGLGAASPDRTVIRRSARRRSGATSAIIKAAEHQRLALTSAG